jgi:glutamyl-tRNA reductase
MNIIGISINHNTASIELREALHLNNDEITELTKRLRNDLLAEGFILSTCNRTEIFGFPQKDVTKAEDLRDFLLSYKPIEDINNDNFEYFFSCSAIKHIFNVAGGIDSLIIGDSQILGQAKSAFEFSEDLGFATSVTRRIFDTATKVGKRAIKETHIGEGAVTVSYAAVQVVEKIFAYLDKKSALVIGAGETGELAAIHLRDKGITKLAITNRTLSRAEALATKVDGEIIPFESFKNHLHEFDIIISATSSDSFLISVNDVADMLKKRKGLTTLLMDIAVPRDIDPGVRKFNNVFYHDMDSLQIIVDQNLQARKDEIPKVDKIIFEEMKTLYDWYHALEVIPTVKSLRSFFDEIRHDELEKIKNKVTEDDYVKLEDMSRRLIGRLLHNPTVKMKELASNERTSQNLKTHIMVLQELFSLNKSEK